VVRWLSTCLHASFFFGRSDLIKRFVELFHPHHILKELKNNYRGIAGRAEEEFEMLCNYLLILVCIEGDFVSQRTRVVVSTSMGTGRRPNDARQQPQRQTHFAANLQAKHDDVKCKSK